MKILFIMPYIPMPATFGGALRSYNLLKIASRHHEVSVIAYNKTVDKEPFMKAFGLESKNIHIVPTGQAFKLRRLKQVYSLIGKHSFFYMLAHSEKMQQTIDAVLESGGYDVVQTEFPHMGSHSLNTSAIKILDEHNVEYENFRRISENVHSPLKRLHYRSEWKKFYREEVDACNRFDSIFVTSQCDKAILDRDVPNIPKHVIPNGVDATYFNPSSETPETFSLVFTGAMSYVPNYDGAIYFLDKIFPLIQSRVPQAKVYFVGSKPTDSLVARSSKSVIVTGYVGDVRPFIGRSSVYIVPLRMGSGTRLKVLEALAMKKPIVTTSIGCEGIDVANGESALVADAPQAFADAVVQLLYDRALVQRLTKNGYDLMKLKYEWNIIGEKMLRLYDELTHGSITLMKNETEQVAV